MCVCAFMHIYVYVQHTERAREREKNKRMMPFIGQIHGYHISALGNTVSFSYIIQSILGQP